MKRLTPLGALLLVALAVLLLAALATFASGQTKPTLTTLTVPRHKLKVERPPILEPQSMIGVYDPRSMKELIAARRRRRIPPTQRIAVFPGENFPGQVDNRASLNATLSEVLRMWNAASRTASLFSSGGIADPFHYEPTPGVCNQLWSGPAQSASPGVSGDKSIFVHLDPNCRYGGEAALGSCCAFATTNSPYVWGHEIGHTEGLNHDRSADFGFYPDGDFDHATVHEYGDPDSLLAGGDYITARARIALGLPITVVQAGRTQGRWTLPEMDDNPTAVVVSREDGQTYVLESHKGAVGVRSSYYGSTFVRRLVNAGDFYHDAVPGGGVDLRYFGNGDVQFAPFVPPPPPTPDPNTQPTPVPTIGSGGTIQPTPCYVGGVIPCTPLPGPTPTPCVTICDEVTPTTPATPTAPPVVNPETPTATETPLPEPTSTPLPTGTPTPIVVPVTPYNPAPPTPHKPGCASFALLSVGIILSGFKLWKRRIK